MHDNTWERVTFLVNLMVGKLDKFDGPIFGGERWSYISGAGGLIFAMLIVLYIFGGVAYIQGLADIAGVLMGFYDIRRNGDLSNLCHSCEFACPQRMSFPGRVKGWGSLTRALIGKFIYMTPHFILLWLNPFDLVKLINVLLMGIAG